MKLNLYSLFVLLLSTILVTLLACQKSQEKPVLPSKLEIRLTDAPARYDAINVNITGLEYNASDDPAATNGWQTLPFNHSGSIDLLKLQNGASSSLTNVEVSNVNIKQLRLKFGATGNTVVDKGITHPLYLSEAIVKSGVAVPVKVELVPGQIASIWIDFNAATSVVYNPATTHPYSLWPDLRAFDYNVTGSLEGTVKPVDADAFVDIVDSTGGGTTSIRVYPAGDDGYFKVVGVPVGKRIVMLRTNTIGYKTKNINVEFRKGETVNIGTQILELSNYPAHPTQFTGIWDVKESIIENPSGRTGSSNFSSISIAKNDSIFGLIQTYRIPPPVWVGSGPNSADTIWLRPRTLNRTLSRQGEGIIGSFSPNRDTLNFTYRHIISTDPTNPYSFDVTQKWIRRKQ